MSLVLYDIASESVVRRLFDTDAGMRLRNKKINFIAYADDIVSGRYWRGRTLGALGYSQNVSKPPPPGRFLSLYYTY